MQEEIMAVKKAHVTEAARVSANTAAEAAAKTAVTVAANGTSAPACRADMARKNTMSHGAATVAATTAHPAAAEALLQAVAGAAEMNMKNMVLLQTAAGTNVETAMMTMITAKAHLLAGVSRDNILN
jgi:hypothetical protein